MATLNRPPQHIENARTVSTADWDKWKQAWLAYRVYFALEPDIVYDTANDRLTVANFDKFPPSFTMNFSNAPYASPTHRWGYGWNNGTHPVILVSADTPEDARRQFKATKYARRKTGPRFALVRNMAATEGFNWQWAETPPPAHTGRG